MSSNDPVTISTRLSDPKLRLVRESDAGAIICLVLEEKGRVVGTGALILDVGGPDDQVGELGRFVVHPKSEGKGYGRRIIEGLFEAAELSASICGTATCKPVVHNP
jgi:GNAT superfamily N-acetyltransferase